MVTEPASSMASDAAPTERQLIASRALLIYKTAKSGLGEWHILGAVDDHAKGYNVGPVVFGDSITVCQNYKGGHCRITLAADGYLVEDFIHGEDLHNPMTITVYCTTTPPCTFDSPGKDKAPGIEMARTFPLAKSYSDFTKIKLRIDLAQSKGTMSLADVRVAQPPYSSQGKGVSDSQLLRERILSLSKPPSVAPAAELQTPKTPMSTATLMAQSCSTGRAKIKDQLNLGHELSAKVEATRLEKIAVLNAMQEARKRMEELEGQLGSLKLEDTASEE